MAPPPPVARVVLRYDVPRSRPDWTLAEEPVPESQPHDLTLELLKAVLVAGLARRGRDALVARNLAVRWDREHPQIGMDPDLSLIEPPPPERVEVESVRTWQQGHAPPRLAIEVVSSRPGKDYEQSPFKCAACGVEELCVFDPKLVGPRRGGGPHRLQLFRREGEDLELVYAGEGPAFSRVLGAWLFVVHEGARLRVADDEPGTRWWATAEQAERLAKETALADKERERAEKERERAEKEAALARIAALEAELARRGA